MIVPRHELVQVIKDYLHGGPKTSREVYEHLAKFGYYRSGTVSRAAKEAGVVYRRRRFQVGAEESIVLWELPT